MTDPIRGSCSGLLLSRKVFAVHFVYITIAYESILEAHPSAPGSFGRTSLRQYFLLQWLSQTQAEIKWWTYLVWSETCYCDRMSMEEARRMQAPTIGLEFHRISHAFWPWSILVWNQTEFDNFRRALVMQSLYRCFAELCAWTSHYPRCRILESHWFRLMAIQKHFRDRLVYTAQFLIWSLNSGRLIAYPALPEHLVVGMFLSTCVFASI